MIDIEIKDVKTFKRTIELIKDILEDINIKFIKDKGIQIISLNEMKTEIVNLILYSNNFEKFVCDKTTIIRLNIKILYKLIKNIDKNDLLNLNINDDSMNILNVNIKGKSIKTCELNLLELEEDHDLKLSLDNDLKITMLSNDFYDISKEFVGMSDYILFNVNKDVNIEGSGKIAKIKFKLNDIEIENKEDSTVSEKFEITDILVFSKFYKLSENINIYLKKESPIILHYNIKNMGNLFLYITPINN